MAIAEALASIPTLFTAVKKIHDTKLQAELMGAILKMQEQLYEAREQQERLQKQLDNLRDIKAQRATLVLKNNAYWKDDTPYCIGCFDGNDRLVPLIRELDISGGDCPVCKTMYPDVFEANPRPAQGPRPKSRHDQFLDT